MKTIWKFELNSKINQAIEMPIDSEILTVQNQFETPCLWAVVYDDKPKEYRHFEVLGTGHNIPSDMGIDRNYIGTFQLQGGTFVFHVFERL